MFNATIRTLSPPRGFAVSVAAAPVASASSRRISTSPKVPRPPSALIFSRRADAVDSQHSQGLLDETDPLTVTNSTGAAAFFYRFQQRYFRLCNDSSHFDS